MYHKTLSYRIFTIFNNVFLTTLAILCLLPLVHLLMVSLSSTAPANAGLVTFWPIGLTFEAYVKTFANANFLSSLWVSVQRTVIGTALAMFVNLIAAYALSKDSRVFRSRNIYLWYFVVTMLFNGGLIPGYILILKLGMMNTMMSLILPGMVAVFNIILLLNFFRTVPKDLEEAAFIDGAGQFRTFITIYLPISLPAIATVSLFTMVGHWNAYFDGLIYIKDSEKLPLASFMQTIIVQADMTKFDPTMIANMSQRTIRASQIFIGALPILLVYPFLQRFFVKGIVIGAVKE
ncbi:sugar ABC transporter permease [Paenibacillus baekrokdamisoli]|uniref:Sugar ABC transporter permease n=1 Tax=Paenibacillus baekrokdamisoli TaxID=1712516 RepID=A0A3G9IZK2_9BACL|nr:carbohydrate ABC transporter permease [Paenibacillus baekrokdamisoli]MBB3067767.1 putative aldouronate transport system permease protein [Paenibacillus baekrokdamisoli]BBH19051.1 sugar ABC transporter permease [Paenibacillus baekrokdamisoli]